MRKCYCLSPTATGAVPTTQPEPSGLAFHRHHRPSILDGLAQLWRRRRQILATPASSIYSKLIAPALVAACTVAPPAYAPAGAPTVRSRRAAHDQQLQHCVPAAVPQSSSPNARPRRAMPRAAYDFAPMSRLPATLAVVGYIALAL